MSFKVGIVGLPNSGKSTLFSVLTNLQVDIANYPFTTIEPNIGVVEIDDQRLIDIGQILNSKKVSKTTIQFVDIAGLIKGASQGEGLGNLFLSHIREVDVITHMVRCFPLSGEATFAIIDMIELINYELMMNDLTIVENRLQKMKKNIEKCSDEINILLKIKDCLQSSKYLADQDLSGLGLVKHLNLLTLKPVIYVLNLIDKSSIDDNITQAINFLTNNNHHFVLISAKTEHELSLLPATERLSFCQTFNLNHNDLQPLIKKCYEKLNLKTFFTAGPTETRAWTFYNGWNAQQVAGIIHTDFEQGFIKAEVYHCDDLIEHKSWIKLKELGKIKHEGKNYLVQDGDVCLFKFNRSQ